MTLDASNGLPEGLLGRSPMPPVSCCQAGKRCTRGAQSWRFSLLAFNTLDARWTLLHTAACKYICPRLLSPGNRLLTPKWWICHLLIAFVKTMLCDSIQIASSCADTRNIPSLGKDFLLTVFTICYPHRLTY